MWLWCTAIHHAKMMIIYWTRKLTHQFSNAFNMTLTLNFCVLRVIGAMVFKFILPLYHLLLVCTISHELVDGFQPDLHGYNIWTWWRDDLILVTLTYFSRSVRDLNCQIWAKRCLCAQYLMNQLADFNQICMDITFGHDKKLNMFWWPWSNFQGHCQT